MLSHSVVQFIQIILKSSGNSPLRECARHSLLYNMSYRLDATAKSDRWIGFREWYRHGWKKHDHDVPFKTTSAPESAHLLITWNHLKDPGSLEYVNKHDALQVSHFLGKDEIHLSHTSSSFFEILLWHSFAMWMAIRCFCFSKQRPNYALMIRESIEMAFVLNLCEKENIERVSFFHPYEIDSNLLSLALMERQIKVQYIPSIIPLYVHNHHLVCDELVITSPYQLEEIKHQFSSSIFYKSLKYWAAESLDESIPKNPNWNISSENQNTLAFYSHGQWLRNQLQRADNGLNLENTEEQLLQMLASLVAETGMKLTVFLHPLEKKHLEKTKAYYSNHLSIDFEYGSLEKRSAQTFEQYHWGIGALSSVIFERLLMGHKTILFHPPAYIFPLASSTLKNITLHQEGDILTRIKDDINCSAKDYFEKNNLLEYYHFPETR